MKTLKTERNHRRGLIALTLVIAAIALIVGLALGFGKLRNLWLEQCVIKDVNEQVTITSGKMVKADVLAENFGLCNGANLALIDFNGKRAEILERIPNLKDIRVSRRLPDKVTIVAEERSPVARLGIVGRTKETGKVVDSEGMVFICQRGTRMLPVIREANAPGTTAGHHLANRSLAALSLIELCREPEYADFAILEIDTSRPDFLKVTIGGTYATVKIAWEGMNEVTPTSRANLKDQLNRLLKAMRSHVGDGAMIWNATDTGSSHRIYADMKGNLR